MSLKEEIFKWANVRGWVNSSLPIKEGNKQQKNEILPKYSRYISENWYSYLLLQWKRLWLQVNDIKKGILK